MVEAKPHVFGIDAQDFEYSCDDGADQPQGEGYIQQKIIGVKEGVDVRAEMMEHRY